MTELRSELVAGNSRCWADVRCCVCGGSEAEVVWGSSVVPEADLVSQFWGTYAGRRAVHARIVRCSACGHRYSSPYLNPETLAHCYQTSSYDNTFEVDEGNLLATLGGYFDAIEPFLPDHDHHLDVGCDVGLFLEYTLSRGFRRATGVEPNRVAHRQAIERLAERPNVELFPEGYCEAALGPGDASLVSFIHVLDHAVDPQLLLGIASRHLKTGGIAVAVTHDIESLLARLTGRNFPPLNLQHPQFFSRRTLESLFERQGYEVVVSRTTWNRFPLYHYAGNLPFLPAKARSRLRRLLAANRLGNHALSLPLGNILVAGRKRN